MSKYTAMMIGAAVMSVATLATPAAQAQWYFGPEGGWTGLEGTRNSINGFNPVTNQSFSLPINHSFNDGFNVGARLGYQWNQWRFEGEYSYRQNTSNATTFGSRINGTLDSNSIMFNALYDFNIGWPVTPHIGFGLGGSSLNGNFNSPLLGYRSKTSDVVFAYQAIAGIRYLMTPNIALDLDYRYRGTSDVNYTTNTFTINGATFPSRRFSGSGSTNNVVASLTYIFSPPPPPPMAAPPPPPPRQRAECFWSSSTGIAIRSRPKARRSYSKRPKLSVPALWSRSRSPVTLIDRVHPHTISVSPSGARTTSPTLCRRWGCREIRWQSAAAARTTTACRPRTESASPRTVASRSLREVRRITTDVCR